MLPRLRFALFTIPIAMMALPAATTQTEAVVPGRSPNDTQTKRRDKYGDPLPHNAVARLGTLRLVHPGFITAVAVSPDGKIVATGNYCNPIPGPPRVSASAKRPPNPSSIRLWDVAQGKLVRTISTPGGSVVDLKFTSGGNDLLGLRQDHLCRWKTATGKLLWKSPLGERGTPPCHYCNRHCEVTCRSKFTYASSCC